MPFDPSKLWVSWITVFIMETANPMRAKRRPKPRQKIVKIQQVFDAKLEYLETSSLTKSKY